MPRRSPSNSSKYTLAAFGPMPGRFSNSPCVWGMRPKLLSCLPISTMCLAVISPRPDFWTMGKMVPHVVPARASTVSSPAQSRATVPAMQDKSGVTAARDKHTRKARHLFSWVTAPFLDRASSSRVSQCQRGGAMPLYRARLTRNILITWNMSEATVTNSSPGFSYFIPFAVFTGFGWAKR